MWLRMPVNVIPGRNPEASLVVKRIYTYYNDLLFNVYIFIAFALDESIILDVPQFPMKNIYQSCDLGRAIGRSNVNAIQ